MKIRKALRFWLGSKASLLALFLLAACGPAAPLQNVSSLPSQLEATPVVEESPTVTFSIPDAPATQVPGLLQQPKTPSAEPIVKPPENQSSVTVEAANQGVQHVPVIDPSPTLASASSSPTSTAIEQDPEPTLAPTEAPSPKVAVLEKDVDSLPVVEPPKEAVPIPTAVPTLVEKLPPPTDVPAPVVREPDAIAAEVPEATEGVHRFVLPSATGGEVALQEFLDKGNVVLVFYRVFW